jgi:electron transport complex protein RnfD
MKKAITTPVIMLTVCAALAPGLIQYAYEFGLIVLLQIVWTCFCCFCIEFAAAKVSQTPYQKSIGNFTWLLTGLLIARSLPVFSPAIYFFLASFIAIAIVKYGAGGMGKNKLNPAMAGLAVVAICFYQQLHLAGELTPAITSALNLKDTLVHFFSMQAYAPLDAMSFATPLTRHFSAANSRSYSWLAFTAGGLFLYYRKIIRIEIPLSIFIAYLSCELFYGYDVSCGLERFCFGGLIFAAFFIATDPVTSPISQLGRIIYGAAIGTAISLIRNNGLYPDGIVFAVLLGNLLTPHIDRWVWKYKVSVQQS